MAALVVYCCCCCCCGCFNYLCYACINSYKPRFFFLTLVSFPSGADLRTQWAAVAAGVVLFFTYVCLFWGGCLRFVGFFFSSLYTYIHYFLYPLYFAAHSPGTKHRHHAVCSSHTLRFTQLIFAIPSELISRVLIPLRPSAGCVRGLAPRATVAPYWSNQFGNSHRQL